MKSPLAALLLMLTAGAGPERVALVPFPDGFREWTHVKSAVNDPGHPGFGAYGGFYSIYANPKAVEGYRTGTFPDGATIVFDMRDARTEGGTTQPGSRRFIDVMRHDAAAFAATGGWGFEKFRGGNREAGTLGPDGPGKCFGCHRTKPDRDYVYTRLTD